jgi:predicted ATPase
MMSANRNKVSCIVFTLTRKQHSKKQHPPLPLSSIQFDNFRLFKSFQLPSITPCHLIMGADSTGKTTIIWGIILLLHAHNGRVLSSKHANQDYIVMESGDLAMLLNYPGLETVALKEFIHGQGKQGKLRGQVNGNEFTCEIQANGVMHLVPSVEPLPNEKIRFSFMAPETNFVSAKKENVLTDELSSTIPNVRSRYNTLTGTSKQAVESYLKDLFSFDSLQPDEKNLLVCKGDSSKVEIMFTGAALRKVFVALVLLYTLIDLPEKQRVFLIEEPEAQLYPVLQRKFLALLIDVAKKNRIQFFVTSNSDCVRNFFSQV